MSLQYFVVYILFNKKKVNLKVYAMQKWWGKAWQQKGIKNT